MQDPAEVIKTFYSAFQRKDWKAMQACYHEEVHFSDPVFPDLRGKMAKAMWHMLTVAGKDLTLTFKNIAVNGTSASCDWDAHYSFSRTGRKVHNVIHATFMFREGKIIRHVDKFDLWRWAGMALGISGKLLGWSPMIQTKVRKAAAKNLAKFAESHPEYQN
jgi:ketosteroid isomerase-like protein